jgi:hypothetical protein
MTVHTLGVRNIFGKTLFSYQLPKAITIFQLASPDNLECAVMALIFHHLWN